MIIIIIDIYLPDNNNITSYQNIVSQINEIKDSFAWTLDLIFKNSNFL